MKLFEWKPVHGQNLEEFQRDVMLYRAQVPGGWLVMSVLVGAMGQVGLTYYPDPTHEWQAGNAPAHAFGT